MGRLVRTHTNQTKTTTDDDSNYDARTKPTHTQKAKLALRKPDSSSSFQIET